MARDIIDARTKSQFADHGIVPAPTVPESWLVPPHGPRLTTDELVAYLVDDEGWRIDIDRRRPPLGELWRATDPAGVTHDYTGMLHKLLAIGYTYTPPQRDLWQFNGGMFTASQLMVELRAAGWRPADPDKPKEALIAPVTPWVPSELCDDYLEQSSRYGDTYAKAWLAAKMNGSFIPLPPAALPSDDRIFEYIATRRPDQPSPTARPGLAPKAS